MTAVLTFATQTLRCECGFLYPDLFRNRIKPPSFLQYFLFGHSRTMYCFVFPFSSVFVSSLTKSVKAKTISSFVGDLFLARIHVRFACGWKLIIFSLATFFSSADDICRLKSQNCVEAKRYNVSKIVRMCNLQSAIHNREFLESRW